MCDKRERSSNFSIDETRLLVDLVVRHKHIIENKALDTAALKQKSTCWDRICALFNASNSVQRNVKTLKLKYDGVKKVLRKKLADEKRCLNGTSDGPKNKVIIEDYEEKLSNILKLNLENVESRVCDALVSSDIVPASCNCHERFNKDINLEDLQDDASRDIIFNYIDLPNETDNPIEILNESPLPIIEASESVKNFNVKKSDDVYSNKKEEITTTISFSKLAETKKRLLEIQIENLLIERNEKMELRRNEIKKQELEMECLLKEHKLKAKLLELEIEKKTIEISLLR